MCKTSLGILGHASLGALLLTLLLILPSCVKNEFSLEFDIDNGGSETFTLSYYASDSRRGMFIESAVQLQGGKAEVKGIVKNPCIVYLMRGSRVMALLYAKPGDKFKFTGQGSNPLEWSISGNKITEQLSKWRIENKDILAPGAPIEKVNAAVAKYILSNADNPVSTILLLEYFDRRADEKEFNRLLGSLKGEALGKEWFEIVARNDMPDPKNKPIAQLPKTIVLKSVAKGCDTIITGKKPIILYFYRPTQDRKDANIEKIRELSREFNDSSKRIIALLSFEPDSLSRWSESRVDSLRNVVEAWVPLGISDSQIRGLGVHRIPYFIVIDKKGTTTYRGDACDKAFDAFRNSLK